jgi:hypothetical protein
VKTLLDEIKIRELAEKLDEALEKGGEVWIDVGKGNIYLAICAGYENRVLQNKRWLRVAILDKSLFEKKGEVTVVLERYIKEWVILHVKGEEEGIVYNSDYGETAFSLIRGRIKISVEKIPKNGWLLIKVVGGR